MEDQTPPRSKRDRRAAAREHAAALRVAEQRRQRRRRVIGWSVSGFVALVAVAAVVVITVTATAQGGTAQAMGPEGMAIESGTALASNTTDAAGTTRDGISCDTGEGSAEHIHTHLAVYVDGKLRPIPLGIGVVTPSVEGAGSPDAFAQATRCYYWLHVHADDGVIHVEAPTKNTYTLGQFFAVWGQPLSSSTVAGATGKQTVYVDGEVVAGDPASIPLGPREDVQIDVGAVVPFHAVDWSRSRL